ncbi:TPA: hypothetical protein ACGUVV_000801 [Vibrio vulnificus]|uniref:hypothetical protein n=1 Tax=Vibrio vulnificus TaxID=672 RepID=UPI000CD2A4A0|nr:hypothetical protein [Vibrio vulnificus]MCU8518021.1 hypothetical protein [Vibrio vulnificus]POB16028.1 hypothetical protein CRN36_20520 [Vibrio vulnificus]HAS6019166.1 hypothetical protein [Vibrio vulnificus]HAS6023928.1 hypothetical protein [Vibrio vulnificus]HAS6034198.1 hypothetical protein [Vibrio vulnificus]
MVSVLEVLYKEVLLELNTAERHIKVCLIAFIADTDIHINNIGEVLSLSISNPTQLLVGAFDKSELIGLIQPLLENNGEPVLPARK